VLIDADSIAKSVKSPRSMNIVMLGAAIKYLEFTPEELKESIKMIFNRKGERIVEENLRALDAGINA